MSSSRDRSLSGRRGPPRSGLTLIELMMAILIVGTTLSPMLNVIKDQNTAGRRNQRLAVAECLTRDSLEFLRYMKFRNGFGWLWARANGAGTFSGVSNPGGGATNPAIDSKFWAPTGNGDPTRDVFDRWVRLTRRTQAGVRYVEVTVIVSNQSDRTLARRPGVPPFFEVVTYIGEHPGR